MRMCPIKYDTTHIHGNMLLTLNDQSTVISIPYQHEVQNCYVSYSPAFYSLQYGQCI